MKVELIPRQLCSAHGRLASEVQAIDMNLTVTATARSIEGQPFTIPARMSLLLSHDGETWWEGAGQNAGFGPDPYVATWPLRAHAARPARAPLVTYDRQGRSTPRRLATIGHADPVWTARFYVVLFHNCDSACEVSAVVE